METIKIEILNPKAKSILQGLADLKLINIRKEKKKPDFFEILTDFRKNSENAPSLEEITKEVEEVRNKRYEN